MDDDLAALAQQSSDKRLIAHLKPQIAKLNGDRLGSSSERTVQVGQPNEIQLEELANSATEDELAA